MRVKQLVFWIALVVNTFHLSAQTGIGTTTPHASAKLEVNAANKGFLPPRVTLTSSSDNSTIPNPATGLLIYNTGTNTGLRAGYYYWNGTDWTTIATPTSAETVDYVSVMLTTDQSNVAAGQNVKFQTIQAGNIPYDASTGNFTLTAGKTYRLTALATLNGTSPAASAVDLTWKLADGTNIGPLASLISANANISYSGQGVIEYIYTPTNNTTISLYVAFVGNSASVLRSNWTNATITQIGSSAIINPWVLSGNDVYNTTGKVGIGTTTPVVPLEVNGAVNASTLSLSNTTSSPSLILKNGDAASAFNDNAQIKMGWAGSTAGTSQYAQFIHTRHNAGTTENAIDFYLSNGTANNTITSGSTRAMSITSPGNVEVAGKLTIGDPSGNVSTKLVGRVNAGTFLTFDNLKFSVTTSDPRGLSIATVNGTVNLYVEGRYNNGGVYGSRTASAIAYNTSPSGSPFGWGFLSAGDTIVYQLTDADNSRMYRVTLIIMPSYINNFIAIERLL